MVIIIIAVTLRLRIDQHDSVLVDCYQQNLWELGLGGLLHTIQKEHITDSSQIRFNLTLTSKKC